jgi:hypothetical protein
MMNYYFITNYSTGVKLISIPILVPLLEVQTNNLFSQVLETEDSNPLIPGQIEVGTALEFQTSRQGTEAAVPIGVEYGISNRLTLLVEPVPYTKIHPKTGASATDFGDLEVTLFYQLFQEGKIRTAISVSGEVKFPTAKNSLVGTKKTDYTPFIIANKTTGKFFTSMNLNYTFLEKPKGVHAGNLFNYALGTIYNASSRNIFFAEVYGNTSTYGGHIPESTTVNPRSNTTEISGGELVGAIGFGKYLSKYLVLSFGISYDNNNAFLFRPE